MNSENWELDLYKFIVKGFFYGFENEKVDYEFKVTNQSFKIKSYFENKSSSINLVDKLTKSMKIKEQTKFVLELQINERKTIPFGKDISEITAFERVGKNDFCNIESLYKKIVEKIKENINNANNNQLQDQNNKTEYLEVKSKKNNLIYLICTLDDGRYLNILKSLKIKKLSNFNKEEIKSLAYSVFAYWEGKESDEPESIKLIINEQTSVESNLKDGYFIFYFENKLANKKELSKIYQSSVYDREDSLNYISEYLKDDYQISNIFLKLPDGCNII
ncbi:MAG: hypothetical protein U0354_09865 [Candidatus Sericytochromatia bacterium]